MLSRKKIRILSRFVKEKDNLRLFQKEAIDNIYDPDNKLIFIEAPVGAGKSYIFQKIITSSKIKEQNIVITYPTKILMDTQINEFKYKNDNVAVWPDEIDNFPLWGDNKINILKYSSKALVEYLFSNPDEYNKFSNKGKLISNGLYNVALGSNKVFVTTPDVLHIIYSKKYKNWKELQGQLKDAIVFIDEYHIYYSLTNFYILLENLIIRSKVNKVILLSATPIIKDTELEGIISKDKIKYISFNNSIAKNEDDGTIFNYPLEVKVHNFKYTDIELLRKKLNELIPEIKIPAAIIFDSIFRLKHLKKYLDTFDETKNGNFKIREWHGLEKSKDILKLVNNNENVIILGTSSIEVGIDLKLKTLITEANYWTNAIQRIGRVGRLPYNNGSINDNIGFVHLFTHSYDLPILLKEKDIYKRNEFEDILIKSLKNPKYENIYGDMFRGESYNFILIDEYIKKPIFYSQNIFSIYNIQDYEYRDFKGDEDEKIELLQDYGINDKIEIKKILIRDKLFPFWGILNSSGLRKEYVRIQSIDKIPEKNPEIIMINTDNNTYKFSRMKKSKNKLPDPF